MKNAHEEHQNECHGGTGSSGATSFIVGISVNGFVNVLATLVPPVGHAHHGEDHDEESADDHKEFNSTGVVGAIHAAERAESEDEGKKETHGVCANNHLASRVAVVVLFIFSHKGGSTHISYRSAGRVPDVHVVIARHDVHGVTDDAVLTFGPSSHAHAEEDYGDATKHGRNGH